MCQLPQETQFDYPWTLRRVPVGEQIDHLAYSSASNTYVLGTSQATSFHLPEDDELHPEWRNEGRFYAKSGINMCANGTGRSRVSSPSSSKLAQTYES